MYVQARDASDFIQDLQDESVPLILTDPPYFGIVSSSWDNAWKDKDHFVQWLTDLFLQALPKLTPTGSLVFFGALGKHGSHPLFPIVSRLESNGYTFRDWMTWKKRRGYGKSHGYLYCREEILWFSKSSVRTEVTFNIPLTETKRGYSGLDFTKGKGKGVCANVPHAKSEYLRVSNVWADIPGQENVIEETELMCPQRICQKPPKLMDRLVSTHSNHGDLIVEPFVGWGTTGISAKSLGRNFLGCEAIPEDAAAANARITESGGIEGNGILDLFE